MKTFTPNFKRQLLFGSIIALMFSSTQVNAQSKAEKVKDTRYESGGSFAGFRPSDEIADKRTKHAKHFKNANGSFTVVTGGTYHYKDAANRWQDISLALVPASKTGYSFANESNEFKTYLPQKPGDYPVQIILSNGVAFNWWQQPSMGFSNGKTAVSAQKRASVLQGDRTINYTNVYEGISEQFEMLDNGVENNTIVHSLSPQIKGLPKGTMIEFAQFIPMPSGWSVDVAGAKKHNNFSAKDFHINIPGSDGIFFGQIVAFDQQLNKDKAMLLINAPEAKLSATEKQQKAQNVLVCNYDVQFVSGGLKVIAKVPADWLKAGNRSFPVTIDPTVTITPPGLGADYYTPTSNWYGFQRHANLYLASEIGISNISISAIEYNRANTNGTNASSPNKVFFRMTTANTLTSAAWNSTTYTGGLTPAFDASVDFHGSTSGWKMFTLAAPFIYTGGNLIVMVYDAYGGSGSAKYMSRSNTVQNRQAGMRQDYTDPGDATTINVENYLPEIRITYNPTSACAGTPNGGTVAASVPDSVCPNVAFTLAADGITFGSGMVYQWQQSATATGPWTDVTGAANPTYTVAAGINTATYYRLRSICNAGTPAYTNVKYITIKSFITCYCTPTYTYGCSNGATINNFSTTAAVVNVTNNNTGCASGAAGYSNYTSMQITAIQGTTFNVSVGVTQYSGGVKIWADWNHDGVFDPVTELCTASPNTIANGGTYNGTVTVPATALLGVTRFRVRVVEGSTSFNPCPNESYGETEDYHILVNTMPACTSVTVPTNIVATATPDNLCVSGSTNLTINTSIPPATGQTFQWQSSPTGAVWTDITGANNATLAVATLTATTHYRLLVKCNSNVVSTSAPDTVIVNTPVQPSATGASRCGPGTLQLTATPAVPAHTVRWYQNASGGLPLGTGNTFTTPSISATTTYYVTEAAAGNITAATLATTDAGGNGCSGGVMFDIDPNINLVIDSFKAKANSSGSNVTVKVYTRNGTFLGNETNASAWTLHTTAVIPTTTAGTQFNIPIPTTISIAPNVVTGIYIEYDAAYTNMPTPTLYSNPDLDIIVGTGLCSSFGGTNSGRAFNGKVHYRANSVCEAARVPVVATVNPVPAVNIGADFDTCLAVSASFNLEAGPQPNNATYLWDNGSTSSSRSISQTGVYHVAVTNSFGCVGRDTINASIRSKPIVDLAPNGTISLCGGGVLVLDAGPGGLNGGDYYWNTGDSLRTLDVTAAGTYIVYVTSPDNCVTIDTAEVVVTGQMPEVDGILITAQTASNFIFTADNPIHVVQYIWDYGDGSPRDTTAGPTTQHHYTANGNYWLKLFSNSTCGEVIDSVMVTIIGGVGVNNVDNDAQIKIYPNPTYDNVVFIETAAGIEMNSLKVFNVVGQEVFSQKVFDKRSNKHRITLNKDLAAGIYHIKIETNRGMVNKKLEILK